MGAVTPDTNQPRPEAPRRRGPYGFPYDWDADELVSRRSLLEWAVLASGALFAATGVLAALGYARERTRGSRQAIVKAAEVPTGGVHYFNYPTSDDQALMLRLKNGQLVAYSSRCTHLSCSVYWDADRGIIHCPCHNGHFDPASGDPIAGPPTRPLSLITLSEEGGTVYALKETLR